MQIQHGEPKDESHSESLFGLSRIVMVDVYCSFFFTELEYKRFTFIMGHYFQFLVPAE